MTPAARDENANVRTRKRLERMRRRRERLVEELAPDLRCAECGESRHVSELVVDHVEGILWDRSKMSPQMRVARYWREYAAGVALRALCTTCSCSDGARRRASGEFPRWKRRRA